MEENLSAEYKFSNCKYRSENEESVTVHRCSCQGGDYTDTGYKCFKRDIFKVAPEICQYCWAFEKR
jgi:hypothetical protein